MDRAHWQFLEQEWNWNYVKTPECLNIVFRGARMPVDPTKICLLDHLDVDLQSNVLELSNLNFSENFSLTATNSVENESDALVT